MFSLDMNSRAMYFRGLDSLRALLFLLIVFSHSPIDLPLTSSKSFIFFYKISWIGVQGFFVLSGFVISNLIIKEITESSSFNSSRFLKRRFLKIVPPFYAVSLLTVFLLPHLALFSVSSSWNAIPPFGSKAYGDTVVALPCFLGFVGNLAYSLNWIAPPTPALLMGWTLAVEEQFYLAVALLFAWAGAKKQSLSARNVIVCLALLATCAFGYRVLHLVNYRSGVVGLDGFIKLSYTHTLSQLDSITIGSLAAMLFNFMPQIMARIVRWWVTPIVFIVLFCIASLVGETWTYTIGMAIINLFWGFVILIIAKRSNFSISMFQERLARIGKNGYCLYLVHHIAILISAGLIGVRNDTSTELAFGVYVVRIMTILLLSWALAEVLYRVVEKPFRQFR